MTTAKLRQMKAEGDKIAMLTSYDYTLARLLDEAGVDNVIVIGIGTNGNGGTENHSWNYVSVDGTWYAVDVTWDDPIVQGLSAVLPAAYRNKYYLKGAATMSNDHVPNGQKRAEAGELLFGTVDSWLIYKMTKGKVHATDATNASRTMLYNINTNKWDDELLKLFNVPKAMLPKVCPSSYQYGVASFFSNKVKICGVAGDQQAALFGQTCFEEGESKNTYGTGCFMLLNTGSQPVLSKNGLLTTVAWQIGDKVTYALEGSVFVGGAVVQWLRDQMRMLHDAAESEKFAAEVKDTNGMYFVPAFVGLGTPYWDDDARGSAFGITRGTTKNHFIRACLEAIAYQCKDVFEIMKEETNGSLKNLKVDGGATKNKLLMQFQSDLLQIEIFLPKCLETTALGVSYLAGLHTGFYSSIEDIKKIHTHQAVFVPKMDKTLVEEKYKGWLKAVDSTRTFE